METAITEATFLGMTKDRSFVKGFARSKINITQKKDIKKPTSTVESGLKQTMTKPAMARELSPS